MATFTTLYTFTLDNGIGIEPYAGLTIDAQGNLIGAATSGGADDNGTIFEFPDEGNGVYGAPITLLTFPGPLGGPNVLGGDPNGNVFIDASGNLIGTAVTGGENLQNPDGTPNDGDGTLYEITNTGSGYAAPSQAVFTFHNNVSDPVIDSQGRYVYGPEASVGGLVADSAGNLYGTSEVGGFIDLGGNQLGEIYEIPYNNGSYASTPTIVTKFLLSDGARPEGPLIIDKNGDLFGTTTLGGPSYTNGIEDDDGTVFELKQGDYSNPITLASFSETGVTPGETPLSGLAMDSAGDLFGTTASGGVPDSNDPFGGDGTVFEIAYSNGSYQPLRTLVNFDGPNGSEPIGGLLVDAAGNLFGTTSGGGQLRGGTVFEIPSAGGYSQLITLVDFTGQSGDALGRVPDGTLTVDAAGDLFGTTYSGGAGNDANGTVFEITDSGYQTAACYCRGTLIQTKRGQKPVEKLQTGDEVMTASGIARPIKWLGKRSYGGRFVMGRKDILPVCIKAGALDENIPRRDLWISPQHAMYFKGDHLEGVLIEAKDLVNGISIVQSERVEKVEYFHVELDSHDVILAEGAFSESFIDDDSRGMFHNAHEYAARYPDEVARPACYCAPRLDEGYEVEAVRRGIALRAGLLRAADGPRSGGLRGYIDLVSETCIAGWAQSVDYSEAAVCLDIYAGGRLIGQTLANGYREDLQQAGLGSGRHAFAFALPDGLIVSSDTVKVRRSLDGAMLEFSGTEKRVLQRSMFSGRDTNTKRAGAETGYPNVKVHRQAARG